MHCFYLPICCHIDVLIFNPLFQKNVMHCILACCILLPFFSCIISTLMI